MRGLALVLALCVLGGMAEAGAGPPPPPELTAAQEALKANLALGDSLGGAAATEVQAAEATRLLQEGLTQARACTLQQPRLAAGHRVMGMLLVWAYRPVESRVAVTDSEGQTAEEVLRTLRQGSKEQLEEGLAELRTATRLAPAQVSYRLDYAEALITFAEDAKGAADLLTALWNRQAEMTAAERARAVNLLARCAHALGLPSDEARWLREVLKNDPKDAAAARRLAELAPAASSGLAWQSYEAGMAIARQEGKPVMIDFMASWCGWCKKLDQEVYTNPDVISVSRQFVPIKVDGDRRGDLTRTYRVTGYPTIVFLDSLGREVGRIPGYVPVPEFLQAMRRVAPSG